MVLPADFGISPAAARFIAERRGDDSAVADVFASATKLKLVLTLAMAVLLAVLAEPIASLYSAPDLAWPLRAVAIALFGQSFVFLFSNAFIALGRNSRDFILTCSEAITEASATIVLVLIAGGATAAAFGRAIGYSVGAIVGVLLLLRLLAPGSWSERRGGPRSAGSPDTPGRCLSSTAPTRSSARSTCCLWEHWSAPRPPASMAPR